MKNANLIKLIELEEGWRNRPYYCSENYPTIGYGFKLGVKNAPLPKFILPKSAGDVWLNEHLEELKTKIMFEPWYTGMNRARRAVIISMMYQMGFTGVLKFKKMIAAIYEGDYGTASDEMLDSRWAKQTPERANRHAIQLNSGEWNSFYNLPLE